MERAIEEQVSAGEMGAVVVTGTASIEAGGSFGRGASLIVDANGRAIASTGVLAIKAGSTAVTSTAANGASALSGGELPEFIFADALDASAGAGSIVEVLLRR